MICITQSAAAFEPRAQRWALAHVQLTGRPLPNVVFYGKPYPEPYRLIEALLRGQAARLGLDGPRTDLLTQGEYASTALPFTGIYAVRESFTLKIQCCKFVSCGF